MTITRRDFLQASSAMLTLPLMPTLFAGETSQPWSFGVIPDTQWNIMNAPFHGTAIHVIDAINAELIRQKVDLVIAVGDLVEESSAMAFQTRAAHNKALDEAGIKFYPFRGNHDSMTLDSVAQFRSAFPGLPGPSDCGGSSPDCPGAQGMTYSFTHKGVQFLCLDTFPLVADGSENGKSYTLDDYLPWIKSELKKDDHEFAFVLSHKNLLGQNHKDNVFNDGGNGREQDDPIDVQNRFIATLQENEVRYFLCGHDHMYSRSIIKSPDGQSAVGQIICGSAAHKFYRPEPPLMKRETVQSQELNRIGFLIATVEGNQIRINYHSTEPFGSEPKTPKWDIRDSFGYSLEVPHSRPIDNT